MVTVGDFWLLLLTVGDREGEGKSIYARTSIRLTSAIASLWRDESARQAAWSDLPGFGRIELARQWRGSHRG